MNQVKTIDVKGLSHKEKEEIIFPALGALGEGESMRMVFDFNPIPLVYMLKAEKEFEISHEKEGPAEWILNIKRIAPSKNRKEIFKALLKDLKGGEVSDQTKEKAKEIFQAIDAKTLGLLEQELIDEGTSRDEIRKSLCDIHLEVLKDALVTQKREVSSPHPVHTFMEEHKLILDALGKLADLVERIKTVESFDQMKDDSDHLKEVAHLLVEAESHHQREGDTLFPKLKAHDITEPVEIMLADHEEFKKKKKTLYNFTYNWKDFPFSEYKKNVLELGSYLAKELESHIFKEDNILYQIALEVLTEKEWSQVKRECDKIGYCCFTPEDRKK